MAPGEALHGSWQVPVSTWQSLPTPDLWQGFVVVCGRFMTPANLLNSLIACYPPEDSTLERAGGLQGDRRAHPVLPANEQMKACIQ